MYGKMKYVRFVDGYEVDCIIVFSTHMNHSDTVKRIRHKEVISAGFVCQDREGLLHCTGHSESLNIDSIPEEDSKILQRQVRGL